MQPRSLLAVLLFATSGLFRATAAEVELVRVWPGHRDAASFTGIGEYFGGTENTRGRTVLRSHPDHRTGFYWLIRTQCASPQSDLSLEIAVRADEAGEPAELTSFPLSLPAGTHPVYAGLTGPEWEAPDRQPLAWRMRILEAATGRVLAEETSFLWADPSTAR